MAIFRPCKWPNIEKLSSHLVTLIIRASPASLSLKLFRQIFAPIKTTSVGKIRSKEIFENRVLEIVRWTLPCLPHRNDPREWSSLEEWDEGGIGPSGKLLCLWLPPKNYATHAWLHSIHIWLFGRSGCWSPSTKELHARGFQMAWF